MALARVYKDSLANMFFFPISYLENIIFSLMMHASLILPPRGLMRRHTRSLKGMVCNSVITDDSG